MRVLSLFFTVLFLLTSSLPGQYLITESDSLLTNSADYLIITHQNFTDKLYPLCKLRDSLGLSVKMVEAPLVYSTFQDVSRADKIKKFTQRVYDTWSKRPLYILLVGDASYSDSTKDYVPSKLFPKFNYSYLGGYTTHASDNWYVQLDGTDYQPDLAIGRFAVSTAQQCEDLVNKTIAYERNADTAGIWRRTICVVASTDYDKYADPLIDTFFMPAKDSVIKVYERFGSSSADLRNKTVAAFNQGIVLLFMVAHGSTTPVWTGSYTLLESADINKFTNTAIFPSVFGRG